MYVDLNPIRAAIADCLEHSVHNSAYDRIEAAKGSEIDSAAFDLVAVDRDEAVKALHEVPMSPFLIQQEFKSLFNDGGKIRPEYKLEGSPKNHHPIELMPGPFARND